MSIVKTSTSNGYFVKTPELERDRRRPRGAAPNGKNVSPPRRDAELPRAASYTYMGDAKSSGYSNPPSIQEPYSEAEMIDDKDDSDDITPSDSGFNTPEEPLPEMGSRAIQARAVVAELQKDPNVSIQPLLDATRDRHSHAISSMTRQKSSVDSAKTVATVASIVPTTPRTRNSLASNFSRKLNRRSWVSTAPTTPNRSPSPAKKESSAPLPEAKPDVEQRGPKRLASKRSLTFPRRKDSLKPAKDNDAEAEAHQSSDDQQKEKVKRTQSQKKRGRPISGLLRSLTTSENDSPNRSRSRSKSKRPSTVATKDGRSVSTSAVNQDAPARSKSKRIPVVPPLPKSFSTDRLPSLRTEQLSPPHRGPVPRLLSSEKSATNGLVMPKKKDELWSVFRNLDGDFAKFASKSLAFKASVLRSSLLPFLRTYASHPSNRTLRAEDLDRRTNILNKWWTGLIEMLHGRNNQSISGTDRPAILDGISGIMERPEWRLSPSPFCPVRLRTRNPSIPRNHSTASLTSNASDFLNESVHHNVRNIFIQNLSAQMAFVVDKMSLRNASASLVTFCGKACAYAFMFVPGMADVLVRVWDLQTDTIRRVLEGNGIGKFDNLASLAGISSFPPALHQLGFTSLMKYTRKLRTPPPLPLGTANIEWWGHWLDRWTGRESDLFYVFVKHFHILATEFLPLDSSKEERMCSPGMLPVHAQILVNLDAAIHRQANQTPQDPTTAGHGPTFDDVLADPDAVAPALPLPPTNAVRLMAENRLIMLIRDFSSERAAEHPIARKVFAESFNDLLQTATRGTSMFDHAACYTLLDFLEEALPLLVRFESDQASKGSMINLNFWTTVWKKMIGSQNTMTEIRLYAFLYTVWSSVIDKLGWKVDVSYDLLLEPSIFESRFNHWCPMVRAYYMRLLCWRVGRYDGEASSGDVGPLETLLERLQTSWSHYLYLRERAARHDILAPPTNPCNPAPSRRLLIIRTDPQVNPGNTFVSFDGIIAPRSTNDVSSAALKRNSTISYNIQIDSRSDSSMSSVSDFEPEQRGRGIGGFFRNLMGSRGRSKSRGPPQTKAVHDTPPMPTGPSLTRAATEDFHATKQSSDLADNVAKPAQPTQHRNFSFKFSLEYNSNLKPLPPMRLLLPRLPLPAQQLLQTYSQKANAPTNITRLVEPTGESAAHARYCGRALAEWNIILGECQSFFERRKNEGVPSNKFVETPTLGVEVFRRPG